MSDEHKRSGQEDSIPSDRDALTAQALVWRAFRDRGKGHGKEVGKRIRTSDLPEWSGRSNRPGFSLESITRRREGSWKRSRQEVYGKEVGKRFMGKKWAVLDSNQ